jgi:hypothetical protein
MRDLPARATEAVGSQAFEGERLEHAGKSLGQPG